MPNHTGLSPNNHLKYLGPNVYLSVVVTRNREPTGADYRQPETGSLYVFGTIWIVGKNPTTGVQGDFWYLAKIAANVAYWVKLASANSGPIFSFTTDVSGPVVPDGSGNVNVTGATNIFSDGSVANTMRLNLQGADHALYVGRGSNLASANLAVGTDGQVLIAATGADPAFATVGINANMNTVVGANTLTLNPYNCAKWIVDPTANIGTHQTITAALAAASSGDTIFVRPATYTEDLTLKAGVHITAFDGDGLTPNVTIVGNCTYSSAGSVTISGIRLQTNAGNFLTVSGSAASVVNLINCYLNCTNNTGISFSTSNANSLVEFFNCQGNIETTGIGYYSQSSTGTLRFYSCNLTNTGNSTLVNNSSAGIMQIFNSRIVSPISNSSTNLIGISDSSILCAGINTTALTFNSSGSALNSIFQSGSSTAIVVNAEITLADCTISSTNTAAISGSGILNYGALVFTNTSSNVTVTSQQLYFEGPSKTIGSSNSGSANILTIINQSNTASSSSQLVVSTAGATAGDPTVLMTTTTTNWIMGIDNSVTTPTADTFVISQGTALGTNNIMSAATSGEINYPLQPAFLAYLPSSDLNVTGDSTTFTIGSVTALTEVFDQNGDFNTNGTFTAPINGKYPLGMVGRYSGCTVASGFVTSIVTSNRNYTNSFSRTAGAQDYTGTMSALCDMDAGDTATFTLLAGGEAGKTVDIVGTANVLTGVWGQLSV